MRYREAYELIDAAVNKADIGYPVTETLKAMFFDQEVENIGLRLVKKSIRASFSVSGKEYVITDSKRSNKIYKVGIYKVIQKSYHPRRAGLRNTKLYNGALTVIYIFTIYFYFNSIFTI